MGITVHIQLARNFELVNENSSSTEGNLTHGYSHGPV